MQEDICLRELPLVFFSVPDIHSSFYTEMLFQWNLIQCFMEFNGFHVFFVHCAIGVFNHCVNHALLCSKCTRLMQYPDYTRVF